MVMEHIPIVASVDDLPSAIEYGERVDTSRWYIMRRATVLKKFDAIPKHWYSGEPVTASALTASAGTAFSVADVVDSVRDCLLDYTSGNTEMEALTASLGEAVWAAHVSGVDVKDETVALVQSFTAAGRLESEEQTEIFEALTASVRRVRTPEGAEFYGQPIGSVIVPNVYLPTGSKQFGDIKAGDFFEHELADGTKLKVRADSDADVSGGQTVVSGTSENVTSTYTKPTSEKVKTFKSAPKGAKAALTPTSGGNPTDAGYRPPGSTNTPEFDAMTQKLRARGYNGVEAAEEATALLGPGGHGKAKASLTDGGGEGIVQTPKAKISPALKKGGLQPGEAAAVDRLVEDAEMGRVEALGYIRAGNDVPDYSKITDVELEDELERLQDMDDPDVVKQKLAVAEIDRRGGLVTKSDAETQAVAEADIAADTSPAAQVAASKAAMEAQRLKANALPSGTGADGPRAQEFKKFSQMMEDHKRLISELGEAGLGNQIPDDGNTIRVRTNAQKILLEDELQGQISDGMWENSSPDWEDWSGATVIVDPENVGRNWYARKDNYQLNGKRLLDIVGDRMIDAVKTKDGNSSYDMGQMRKDLADLSKIFKTKRPEHTAIDAAETAERDGVPSTDVAGHDDSDVETALDSLANSGLLNEMGSDFMTDARAEKIADKMERDGHKRSAAVEAIRRARLTAESDAVESNAKHDRAVAKAMESNAQITGDTAVVDVNGTKRLVKVDSITKGQVYGNTIDSLEPLYVDGGDWDNRASKPAVDTAGTVTPTAPGSTGTNNWIDDKSTSLGTINPGAKGKDPERFIPKVSFADGSTPKAGNRVRDKKGRLGTVEETYQAYTAIRWDDSGKVQTVKNDRINSTGGTAPTAMPQDDAAGKATEKTTKVVDNSPTVDTGGAAALPDSAPAITDAVTDRELDSERDEINQELHGYTVKSLLETRSVTLAEIEAAEAEPNSGRFRPTITVKEPSYYEVGISTDLARRELGYPARPGKTLRGKAATVRQAQLDLLEAESGLYGRVMTTDEAMAAERAVRAARDALRDARALPDEKSAAELIAAGVSGKELRDALRRENPSWSNAQVHAVARSMAARAGLTASGAVPTRIEIMRADTALRKFIKAQGF